MKKESSKYLFGLRMLRKLLPDSEKEYLIDSIEEYYHEMKDSKSSLAVNLWFLKELFLTAVNIINDNAYRSMIMFYNYIKIAIRLMKRNPGYSFINISGLVAGITSCIFISLWVNNELSYENSHSNADKVYRVLLKRADDHPSGPRVSSYTTPGISGMIETNIPDVKHTLRFTIPLLRPEILVAYKRNQFYSTSFGFADPSIFEMFSIKFISGSKESALVDPNSIIITKSMADRYFHDEDPIGKVIRVENEFNYTVEGVIEDPVNNTHMKYESLIPFVNIEKFMPQYGEFINTLDLHFFNNYVMLEENTDMDQVNEKVYNLFHEHAMTLPEEEQSSYNYEFLLQPIKDIHLRSENIVYRGQKGNINNVYIFSISALLILLIAGINFTNLTTARSAFRAKEVGMRKTFGALRRNLIGQFFGESISFALLAFIISLILLIVFSPYFESATNINFNLDNSENLFFLAKIFAAVLGIGLLSGLYPALYLSAFRPVQVLKGIGRSGESKGLFRKILVVSQFAISISLVICASIIYQQNNYILNMDIGYEKDLVIYSKLSPQLKESYSVLKEKLLSDPFVKNVTFSSNTQFPGAIFVSDFNWEGKEPGSVAMMSNVHVDEDFIETLGLEIVEGRGFSENSNATPFREIIINESAAKKIGLPSVIGLNVFPQWDDPPKIVGVVKDYNFRSLHEKIGPLMMGISPGSFKYAHIKLNSENFEQAIGSIESVFRELDAEAPFDYKFTDDTFTNQYKNEKQAGNYLILFTLLSIFTTCLGLYGLTSFSIESRMKEIGIRKVLGAKISSILRIIMREFVILIIISNILAWPMAYYFAENWLEGFAYKIDIGIGVFLISGIFVLVFTILTVMKQTISAARSNPVDSLRYE